MIGIKPSGKVNSVNKRSARTAVSVIDNPLVSVVIPTYNRRHSIERAISSVETQTYRPLELIIVDDASLDDTAALVESLNFSIPLSLVRHSRNKGGAAARNSGIANAKGDYVAFLDSDDSWHPQKIEKQIELMDKAGDAYGVCYTGVARYDDHQNLLTWTNPILSGDISTPLLRNNFVDTFSSAVVRRSLIQKVGGLDESLRSCQDWDLWIRLSQITQFVAVNYPLTNYTVGSTGRITTNPSHRLSGHLTIYRKHLRAAFKQNQVNPHEFQFLIGETLMQLGKPKSARPFLIASLNNGRPTLRCVLTVILAILKVRPPAYAKINRLISNGRILGHRSRRRLVGINFQK